MVIEKSKNSLTVSGKNFLPQQILNSGQVFRHKRYKDGYLLNAGNETAFLRKIKDTVYIECSNENYFYNYFDLATDYGIIIKKLQAYPFMKDALTAGSGIRLLKQQKLETIISFIISANNNIKRIAKIIDNICALGKSCKFGDITYRAFPDIEELNAADEKFFINAGAGYRAAYIKKTVQMIYNGFDIYGIEDMDSASARKQLTKLYGVGRKVCDCILLFAYNRLDVFPVDTWIEKVYNDYIPKSENICRKYISDYFAEKFGSLAGYAQQYLFYYKRLGGRFDENI